MAWVVTDSIRGSKGDKGDKGDPGSNGTNGTNGQNGAPGAAGTPATIVGVGATTLAPTQPASVSMSGPASSRSFTFGIPRGEKGEQGIPGTLSSASAEAVPAGSPAEVIMSGTTEVKHAHFKVPRGLPGSNAIENDEAVAAYLGAIDSALTAAFYARLQLGNVGIEKPNPANALIYIGSGTGTLPDNQIMGIKVRLDTPAGGRRDGIQSNVKVTPDAGAGSVRGMLSRVDLADSAGLTGDIVAMWGDAWITANSSRGTWGGNLYVSIRDGVDYKGNAHGLEVGFENRGIRDNAGGGLLVVGKGITNKAAFGIKISSDPMMGGAGTFKTNLLMATQSAPSENYIWIGSAGNNTPSGAPLMQVRADGAVAIGTAVSEGAALSIGGEIRFGTGSAGVRLIAGSGSPEGVVTAPRGSVYLNVSGAAGTTFYVKTSGGTDNTGWTAK